MKEIDFSTLTLDLKKQFIYFLAKNDIDFQSLKNSRFMTTKIRITGANNKPTRIVIKPEDVWHLANKSKKISKYHINCQEDALHYRTPEKNGRSPKSKKTQKSKNRYNDDNIGKTNDFSVKKKTSQKNFGILGDDLLLNLESYINMKSELRAEPEYKIDQDKYKRNLRLKGNYFPNKNRNFEKDGIFYNDDIEDKRYFYQKIKKKLSPRKNERCNFFF